VLLAEHTVLYGEEWKGGGMSRSERLGVCGGQENRDLGKEVERRDKVGYRVGLHQTGQMPGRSKYERVRQGMEIYLFGGIPPECAELCAFFFFEIVECRLQ
jgi:hypothetical protein